MYKLINILLLLILTTLGSAAQVLDRAPTGKENILPVEGGGIRMKIDSLTPLNELINKLNGEWELIETGKAYWIGYTNDMFSIATRGDEAIPALTYFFKTTQNRNGKIGAILTLHLIGINRQIVGRFREHFVDSNARIALLDLLKNKDYTYSIIGLLMRDPWQTDISYFFKILENETDDEITWPIINSLKRYEIVNLPINNHIPDEIRNLTIRLKVENENTLESNFDFNSQIKDALKEFGKKFPGSIKIEEELYTQQLTEYYRTKLSSSLSIIDFVTSLGIDSNSPFSYVEIGCKIQYYIKDGILHFCSIKTAANLLTAWWAKSQKDKNE